MIYLIIYLILGLIYGFYCFTKILILARNYGNNISFIDIFMCFIVLPLFWPMIFIFKDKFE